MRLSLTPFSYSFVLSAKAFKKRLRVSLLTDLPLLASHSALAVFNRWRLAFTDAKTNTSSVVLFINGLRPLPFFVFKPSTPSSAYQTNQLFTARAAPSHFAHFYNFGYFFRFSIFRFKENYLASNSICLRFTCFETLFQLIFGF